MASQSVDTGSAFEITELTGEGRAVSLLGRGLPYRPFTIKSLQRLELTWYPGNPVATSTILGAGLEPTTIHGYWKDKYIGNSIDSLTATANTNGNQVAAITLNKQQIATCRDAAKLFRSLVASGQLLEVRWDEIVRRGHLKDFQEDWHDTRDLEWTMSFDWISTGDDTGSPAFQTETTVGDTNNVLRAQNTALQRSAIPTFPIASTFNVAMVGNLTTINNSVMQGSTVETNLASSSISPFDSTRRMVAITGGVALQTQALIRFFSSQPPRTLNVGVTNVSTMTLGQIVQAESYVRGVQRNAAKMRRTAVIRQILLAAQIESNLLAIYRARQNDDLRDVSRLYYGTTTQWRNLMYFNELSGSGGLTGGELIMVPKLTTGGSGGTTS